MSPNNQLADRCEKATGPNFRLEQEIWAAVVARPPCPNVDAFGQIKPPAFTASLDAAMTLIEGERPIVILHAAIDACGAEAQLFANRDEIFVKRLPLFVCAAALRARQS